MKVAGKAKQIDLMRNTDCRERSNLFHVIDIGCLFNQLNKQNSSIIAGAQRYCFNYLVVAMYIYIITYTMMCLVSLYHMQMLYIDRYYEPRHEKPEDQWSCKRSPDS